MLVAVGAQLLRETTNDAVVAVFRLAIAEAVRAPEIAEALELHGRQTGRAALTAIMTHATTRGLLHGHQVELAEQFSGLLSGDLKHAGRHILDVDVDDGHDRVREQCR